jgi:LacI family transcriptional regulator
MPLRTKVRIAVLVGSSLAWRELVMRGIANYSNAHGHWHVYTAPEATENLVFFTERYKWDGLIVRPTSDRFVRRILSLGVPTVCIGSVRVPSPRLPRVKVDDDALMRTAVNHLISCGLRRFAYCNLVPKDSTEDRAPAFARAVRERGFECTFYGGFKTDAAGQTWQKRQRDLARWVKRLAYPVGIVTWNPDVGCQLVEACQLAGVTVPDDVAIVTADDDPVKCELTSPTVSAVAIPAAQIGYQAAELLHSLIRGRAAPEQPILIPPSGVVTARESSAILGVADREVQEALRLMREHVADGISVSDVARSINVSRSWLERHFRRTIHRAPHEEILRVRLEEAKRLLIETDWPAKRIADRSGFSSASYLNHCLRADAGVTPLQFRRRFRSGRRPRN